MPAAYDITECDVFKPRLLTKDEELLPWSAWIWNETLGGYERRCPGHTLVGLIFSPYDLFFNGIHSAYQYAYKSKSPSKRSRAIAKKKAETLALEFHGEDSPWMCAYCLKLGSQSVGPDGRSWHVDHIYPVSKGGDNLPDNLVLSCATCNLQKGALRLKEFLEYVQEKPSAQE